MAIKIGSNLPAQRIVRSLNEASNSLGRALERLGSGLRINRASDDPAGLAVGSQLRAQARILGRGRLNINDAASLLNIADGATGQISELLTRMQELAAQAANDTFSLSQRQSLNQEYQALDREIRRVTAGTTFNGLNLFSGQAATPSATTLDSTGQVTAISQDGEYALFQDSLYQTKLFNKSTGTSTTISPPTGTTGVINAIFTPGDQIILKASTVSATDYYLYDPTTRNYTKLTNSKTISDASWSGAQISADGTSFIFRSVTNYADNAGVSSATGSGVGQLNVLNLTTGIIRVVSGVTNPGTFQISADGKSIALSSTSNPLGLNGDGGQEIFKYTLGANGYSATQQLTSHAGIASLGVLATTSDGRTYYIDNALGAAVLERSASGTVRTLATYATTGNYGFSISADETKVNLLSAQNLTGLNASGVPQLYTFDLSTNSVTQRTRFNGTEPFFVTYISGDGNSLINVDEDYGVVPTFYDTRMTASTFDFEAGTGARGRITAALSALDSIVTGLGALDISTAAGGRNALERMRSNLENLSALRGIIGAGQSRLLSANSLLESQTSEFASAESRIMSADIAEESAALIRTSILRSTSAALLAQANQQPSLALQLLNF